jgi:O-antigen ligase
MRSFVNKVQVFLLCFTAFVLPLYIKATSISLVLLLIFAFFTKENRKQIVLLLKDYRYYIFISPIIVALIGLLVGEYSPSRLQIITVLSSLIFFPIIIKTFSINNFRRRHLWVNTWFIIGLLTAFIICISTSLSDYFHTGKISELYYTRLTHLIMLPNQLSIYVLWGILLLLYDLINRKKQLVFFNNTIAKIVIVLLLMTFLFLMASKAAFLIFCLSIIAVFGIMIRNRIIPIWQSAIIIALLLAPSIYLFNHTNIKPRIKVTYNLLVKKTSVNYGSTESTALRMAALNASIKLIKDNYLTGVGTGNVKKALIEQYQKDRVPSNYKLQTNPHNQFVYSLTMNGIAGFLALVGVFIIMFVSAFKENEDTIFLWTFVSMLFFMSDDLLVIQVGVIFFTFVSSLLLWGKYKRANNCK